MIEKEEVVNARARELLINHRNSVYGGNSRPLVAKEISRILGRPIPTTTYTGYETNRNAPIEVRLAICELYKLPLFLVLGLKENPDSKTYGALDKAG